MQTTTEEIDVVKVMLRPDMPASALRTDNALWRTIERAAAKAVLTQFGVTDRAFRVDVLAFSDETPVTVLAQRRIQNGWLDRYAT